MKRVPRRDADRGERENVKIDEQWFERWLSVWPGHIAAGGPGGEPVAQAIMDMFHPEGQWEDVAGNVAWTGRDQLPAMFEMSYQWCPNLLHHPLHAQFDGNQYAIDWEMKGCGGAEFAGFPAHDREFAIRGASTGEVDRAGLIVRHSDYWSLFDWLTQCGHLDPLAIEPDAL
jgi:hypothetical protein